jgi:hypothetical protein
MGQRRRANSWEVPNDQAVKAVQGAWPMTAFAPLPTLSTRPLAWLRARFRASEAWFIVLSIVVGAGAGLLAVIQARVAHGLQERLFGITPDIRLSATTHLDPMSLLWLPAGGLLLAGANYLLGFWKNRPVIDVVEANSLYGGRMSLRGSLVICVQTLISNGFGASVGLEAAYAQAGGGPRRSASGCGCGGTTCAPWWAPAPAQGSAPRSARRWPGPSMHSRW